ncbi:MAG TPA: hypothetical protein VGD91_27885 [Trebonia sp.]
MAPGLTGVLAAREIVVLDGCDGTGKTTLAQDMRAQYGYRVIHSGRTPDGIDLVRRYRRILAVPGPVVLDRSFISELVYGPLFHGRSRLSRADALSLAAAVGDRGGVLVHLTGSPDAIIARLRHRDGAAPGVDTVNAVVAAYRTAFALLADAAPVVVADLAE